MGKFERYGGCRFDGAVLEYRNKQTHGYFSSMEIKKSQKEKKMIYQMKSSQQSKKEMR